MHDFAAKILEVPKGDNPPEPRGDPTGRRDIVPQPADHSLASPISIPVQGRRKNRGEK